MRHLRGKIRGDRGVALIMVLFIVALATVLVTQITYESTLRMRTSLMVQRSLQAEYLLKSTINFARALIREDTSPEDGPQDTWGRFKDGIGIPGDLLGLSDRSVRLFLEIRPEEGKLPIRHLVRGSGVQVIWRDILVRFFERMGFDEDGEADHTGLFPDRVFDSREMVANLIDYMDRDQESYRADDFVNGIEDAIEEDYFSNRSIRRISELSLIPGFTPNRVRKIRPFVSAFGRPVININFVPRVVLESLTEEIDPGEAEALIDFREGPDGPFTDVNKVQQIETLAGREAWLEIASITKTDSAYFQALAKADYGASTYFGRAIIIQNNDGEIPSLHSLELY